MFTYKGVTCETIEELKLLMASLDRPTCPQVPQQMPSFPSREWHEDLVERRYQKEEAERVARELRVADKERRRQNFIPTRVPPGSTTPPQAMPEGHRGDDVVAAYRRYYCAEKQGYWVRERWVVSKWTRRDVPWFMIDGEATMR